jgi:hypothetical protein
MNEQQTWWEKVEVRGGEVLDALKRILHEGNIRRVRIRQADRVVAEFPLTVGVVGAVVAPILAAVGALVALLAECSIEVERTGERPASSEAAGGTEETPRPQA